MLSNFFLGLYINLTREATLCQNILNALQIFPRISKFRFFYESKQTQNEVGRFFYNLAEFVFEYFCDSRRILATFAKFCLNSLFATWSYRYLNPKHVIQRARARAPLHLTHAFLTRQNFTNTSPCSQFILRLRGRPISARKQHVGS